ncbi:ABC transporter substrate-binding protein [Peribacillus frigoritolerans]|uniref:ABC transporter substrate-binding protein n=1 Tax=Peribacillus frigoritolerans TaxID=450367 RepID=UPI00070D0EAD|nr:extracellular solute-binding protein [Peribacillus frigoritolerans]KRF59064.1 ABC transporter substrate-binding protein [Bacillus sp. Soil745]MBD8137565.1 extracellular solute-binding protein [Bacillus sp. CFBP 13597]PAW27895.1 ABC transporter substrate-binding protein [Peribacillus simplex]PEO44030.1 ABC transporter substrate-binding protein [Bacillus sp. AFS026049]MCR8870641.1 extracellular solute-binding protein [Peribacillus frigoritolerans]
MNRTFKKNCYKSIQALMLGVSVLGLAACGATNEEAAPVVKDPSSLTLKEIETKAKVEGTINSVGMPDSWANWGETWNEVMKKYTLEHNDTDLSSAEEIAKMESEGENATADIGDVGISFGPIAEQKELTMPYKTSYWDGVPEWAKDDNGDWVVGYQGTIAFFTNKELVDNPPKSWDDILRGDYKVTVGDVQRGTQNQMAVLAAAIANGGDETNLQPGIDFFAKLAKQGRLSLTDAKPANIEKGEVEVALVWDFNALGYADQINRDQFEVTIPTEGSVVSGYATIINKFAKHPHAAMATREYILSDEGQINLAKGFARPIRDVELPKEVAEKMVPEEQYKNAKPIEDYKAWEETAKNLPQIWQEEVLVHVK